MQLKVYSCEFYEIFRNSFFIEPQPVFSCSNLIMETPEECVKSVQG